MKATRKVEVYYDMTLAQYVVVVNEYNGGRRWVGYVENSNWMFQEVREAEPADINKLLKLPENIARGLYEALKKEFEPKEVISIDAMDIMNDHLQDMRKLVFDGEPTVVEIDGHEISKLIKKAVKGEE